MEIQNIFSYKTVNDRLPAISTLTDLFEGTSRFEKVRHKPHGPNRYRNFTFSTACSNQSKIKLIVIYNKQSQFKQLNWIWSKPLRKYLLKIHQRKQLSRIHLNLCWQNPVFNLNWFPYSMPSWPWILLSESLTCLKTIKLIINRQ